MTDYELVKSKSYYEIWKKYQPLIMKFYVKLTDNKIYAFDGFQDFYQSCYEYVVQAVDSIKLNKIKKPETWTIYIQLYHYIQNYTTRKVVKEYYADNQLISYDAELNAGSYTDDNSIFEKVESLKQVIPQLSDHERMLLKKYIESGGVRSKARDELLNKIRRMCK